MRTIRDRILSREQRASYLLELYQQIRREDNREVIADNTLEQSELQLSGLVVRQQNKLRVYNPIYKEIFDQDWIETQLRNLRPYSENFKFWVASGGSDNSRLLRAKALQDALEWSIDKSLSYQDRQFLAASQAKEREEEIAALEKEAALERERKDREAAQQRNQVLTEANQTLADANDTLTEANKKAKRRIRVGSVVLFLTLLGAVISGSLAVVNLGRIQEQAKNLSKLSELSGELQSRNQQEDADEARRKLGLSYAIKENNKLQQPLLLSSIAFAYQKLGDKKKASEEIQHSVKLLRLEDKESSSLEKEVGVYVLNIQGALLKEQNNNTEAIKAYKEAFNLLQSNSVELNPFYGKTQILNAVTVESMHSGLIDLLTESEDKKLLSQVKESLKEHYYAELDNLLKNKKWKAADSLTFKLMLYITKGEEKGYLDTEDIKKLSCPDLRRIDDNWKNHSDGHFGFGVQKQIWLDTLNRQEYNEKAYEKFLSRLRWDEWDYDMIIREVEKDYNKAPKGILPILPIVLRINYYEYRNTDEFYISISRNIKNSDNSSGMKQDIQSSIKRLQDGDDTTNIQLRKEKIITNQPSLWEMELFSRSRVCQL